MSRVILCLVSDKDGLFHSDFSYKSQDVQRMAVRQGRIEFNPSDDFSNPFDICCDCMVGALDTIFPDKNQLQLGVFTWKNSELQLCSNPTKTSCEVENVTFRITSENGKIKRANKLFLDLILFKPSLHASSRG